MHQRPSVSALYVHLPYPRLSDRRDRFRLVTDRIEADLHTVPAGDGGGDSVIASIAEVRQHSWKARVREDLRERLGRCQLAHPQVCCFVRLDQERRP